MDIAKILQNFNVIEGRTSPVSTRTGLTPQQKSVNQLPALFRPKKISVLTNKNDPQHPTAGHFVGDDIDVAQTPLEEAMRNVEEDMIQKTRADLKQYLDMLSKKTQENNELVKQAKDVVEKSLTQDHQEPVEEDPTESPPPTSPPESRPNVQSDSGSIPIKTMTLEDGKILEIHGDEQQGFRVGYQNRFINRRFKNIDDAAMAVDIFRSRHRKNLPNADYIEER